MQLVCRSLAMGLSPGYLPHSHTRLVLVTVTAATLMSIEGAAPPTPATGSLTNLSIYDSLLSFSPEHTIPSNSSRSYVW
jgi:hypothetical protein